MVITLKDRKVFYDKLMANLSGYQDDLKSQVDLDESKFDKLYSESGSVGLIKNGIDGLLKKRYSVTALGKEQISSFLMVYDF